MQKITFYAYIVYFYNQGTDIGIGSFIESIYTCSKLLQKNFCSTVKSGFFLTVYSGIIHNDIARRAKAFNLLRRFTLLSKTRQILPVKILLQLFEECGIGTQRR